MAAPSIKSGTGIETIHTLDNGNPHPGGTGAPAPIDLLSDHGFDGTGAKSARGSDGIGGTGCQQPGSGSGVTYSAAHFYGSTHALTTAEDMTGKLFALHISNYTESATYDLGASSGVMIHMNSSSLGTEERSWPVLGANVAHSGWAPFVVNPARTADAYTDTSFDITDVTHVGTAANWKGGFRSFYLDSYCLITPAVAINGDVSPNGPGDITLFRDHSDYQESTLVDGPTPELNYVFIPLEIGDGSTATRYTDDGIVVQFPSQPSLSSAPYSGNAHVNDNDLGLRVNASASDVITLNACTYLSGDPCYFKIEGSTSATVTVTGNTVALSGGEFVIVDGATVSGNIFDGMAACEASQPTITNNTFKNAPGSALILDTNNGLANSGGNTFTDNDVAIEVNIPTGDCAIDVTAETFSGSVTADIEFGGTGTLTVTATSAQAASLTTNNTGSGSIVVSAPIDTFTLNSDQSSSTIRVYTSGTSGASATVLDSATGTQVAYDHSGETVDYTVEKSGYKPVRVTGLTLSGDLTINVELEPDPAYNASHGLTNGTEYAYNATTRALTIDGATHGAQQGRDLYSALIDDFISETAYRNKPFPCSSIGINRIDFTSDGTTAATIDAGDVQYWIGAGMEWEHATTGNPTHKYCSIVGTGTNAAGTKGFFQQVDGASPTALSLVSNNVNQVIRYYRDDNGDGDTSGASEYDYSDHLVVKLFNDGYYQASNDILVSQGITALESFEYVIPMGMTSTGLGTGDRGITITVTDNTPAGVEEQTGYTFDYKVEGGASDSPEDLLRQQVYDIWLDPTASNYASKVNFNWPDFIVESGGNYTAQRGYVYGQDTTTTYHGFYFEEGAGYHPDFLRQQANDGTHFVTPVVAQANVSGMETTETYVRLQLWNASATSASARANSTAYSVGDIRLRSTGLGSENTAGLYLRCSTAGTSAGSEPTWNTTPGGTTTDGTAVWTTYKVLFYDDDAASATYGTTYTDGEEFSSGETVGYRFAYINGSTGAGKTSGTAVATSSGFTIALSSEADSVYASNGIDGQAEDTKFSPNFTSNYIVLDANSDFTAAGAYAYFCYTLTTSQGMWAFWGGVTAIDTGNYRINNDTLDLYFDESAGFVKQTDNARIFRADGARPAIDPTTGGNGIEVNWKNPVYIETTGSALTAPQAAELAAAASNSSSIKAKTDSLTFTNAGQVDANAKAMNDATIYGVGTENDKWTGTAP